MAFTNTPGYVWTDGEVVTATKLNSAATPTIADGQSYGFASGAVGTPSINFSAETTLGFYRNTAATVGLVGNLAQINATTSSQWQTGQDSTHNLNLLWTYNATPSSASATIGTFGKSNPLTIQGSIVSIDSASLAFAVQIVASGRVRIGGGSDDGINAFQVVGSATADMYVANPSTLTYAATTNVDLFTNDVQTVSLTGNVTFTTSNRLSGRSKTLRIVCDGTPRTLTFPSFVFMNAVAPTSIAASKTGVLTLLAFGSNNTDIVATYIVQP